MSAGQAADPRAAERPLEAALAAQTTGATRRAAAIYTLRRAREKSVRAFRKGRRRRGREKGAKRATAKSVTADFRLVTTTAYSNFSTRTRPTSQPPPDFQDRDSQNSQNFNPENFIFSF